MGKISRFILHHNKKILIVMIIFSIFFAVNAVNLKTGFDLEQFAPKDTPSIELFEKISKNFPSSTQDQEYILIEGDVATVDSLEGISKTYENFEDNKFIAENPDGSLKVNSIYSIIQDIIENNQSLFEIFNINKETGIPKTNRDVKNLFDYLYNKESESFENFDLENFDIKNIEELQKQDIEIDNIAEQVKNVLHKNDRGQYDSTVIRIFISFQENGEEFENFEDSLGSLKNEILEDMTDYGDAEASLTGEYILTLEITNSLTDSQILSTGISIILAIIVLIIAYRNPLLGLTTIIPVGITMIWILGTMYLIGYSLNAMTITITSITIGIGIDYSIHATERFRLVTDKTGDIEKAMCETISHTGGALLIAALTTACGFGILAFAPIPPQQQFGVILSVTIVYSFLTAILILPSILVRWAEWRRKRKGYIVTTNGMKKVNDKWVKDKKNE
jgi:predicted RND superfamily exporter protein